MCQFSWLHSGFGSAGRDAAIDEERLAGYVTAGFGSEKDDGSVKIVGPPWPLHGNAIREVLHPRRILVHNLVLPGAKPAGSEAVDGNPVFPPVVGQTHGQLPGSTATGAVGPQADVPGDAGHRSNVDAAPIAALGHAVRDRLRHKERAAQVGVEHRVPIFPGYVQGKFADIAASVVDQDIDMTEVCFDGGDSALDAAVVADVEDDRKVCRPSARISSAKTESDSLSRLVMAISAPARAKARAKY